MQISFFLPMKPPILPYIQKLPEVRYSYDIDGTYVHMDVK